MLIVGDGIREGGAQLVEYLNRDIGLSYRFGLIELAVYRMQEGAPSGYILQLRGDPPRHRAGWRCGARGARRRRASNRHGGAAHERGGHQGRPRAGRSGLVPLLDGFLALIALLGVQLSVHGIGKINFGRIFPDSRIATNYICESARRAGDIAIGLD